jgi:hypothetical protein
LASKFAMCSEFDHWLYASKVTAYPPPTSGVAPIAPMLLIGGKVSWAAAPTGCPAAVKACTLSVPLPCA